jgi:hypothetical protein
MPIRKDPPLLPTILYVSTIPSPWSQAELVMDRY